MDDLKAMPVASSTFAATVGDQEPANSRGLVWAILAVGLIAPFMFRWLRREHRKLNQTP